MRGPHTARGLPGSVQQIIAAVGDRDVLGQEADGFDGDGPFAAFALRGGERAFDERIAALAPFAGGDELIGIGGEEILEGLGIGVIANVDIFLDGRADGGFGSAAAKVDARR